VLLALFLRAAAATFDQETAMLAPGEVERLGDGLREGTIMVAAASREGRPVAGASLVRAGDVAELVGVWCRQDWRRQGLARACCRRVVEHFRAAGGDLVWLSTGDEASTGLYRSLGFSPCGTQLNYAASWPPS
jgi:ribosomal protein S18 acetylase RimI-like enzyme